MLNGSNPKDANVINVLKKNGLDGIWYRDGRPDFTPISSFNVPIENMSNNRTGKGGNYEQARKAITNEIMNANGNINILIQNGVISDYATPYTKKQVQKFLRSEDVQGAILMKDYDMLEIAVSDYIKDNHLVVHEVNTIDTQVIPFDVNNRYNHDGGVSDTKKAEKSVSKCDK